MLFRKVEIVSPIGDTIIQGYVFTKNNKYYICNTRYTDPIILEYDATIVPPNGIEFSEMVDKKDIPERIKDVIEKFISNDTIKEYSLDDDCF